MNNSRAQPITTAMVNAQTANVGVWASVTRIAGVPFGRTARLLSSDAQNMYGPAFALEALDSSDQPRKIAKRGHIFQVIPS